MKKKTALGWRGVPTQGMRTRITNGCVPSWPGSRQTRARRHLEEAPVPRPCRPEFRICHNQQFCTQATAWVGEKKQETPRSPHRLCSDKIESHEVQNSSDELPLSVHDWQPWPRSASKCISVPGISVALTTTEEEEMIQFANHIWLLQRSCFVALCQPVVMHDYSQRSLCEPTSLGTERRRRLAPKFVGEGILIKVFLTCWHSEAAPSDH